MRKKPPPGVQGEGDYISGRRFQEEQRSFVEHGPVDEAAREAADALSGPEARDLEAARQAAAEGHAARKSQIAHRERKLDTALEQTFPASDPVSISPGAD